ncbi:hypothetical protein ACFPRL_06805 [Pseudoclavibacter helvolus]
MLFETSRPTMSKPSLLSAACAAMFASSIARVLAVIRCLSLRAQESPSWCPRGDALAS